MRTNCRRGIGKKQTFRLGLKVGPYFAHWRRNFSAAAGGPRVVQAHAPDQTAFKDFFTLGINCSSTQKRSPGSSVFSQRHWFGFMVSRL